MGSVLSEHIARPNPLVGVALVVDSLFNHIDILREWHLQGVYGSIGLRTKQTAPFTRHLNKGQHRLYTFHGVVISVFSDNAVVGNASMIFEATEVSPHLQADIVLPPPTVQRFSDEGIRGLHAWARSHPEDFRTLVGLFSRSTAVASSSEPQLSVLCGVSRTRLEAILRHDHDQPDRSGVSQPAVRRYHRLGVGESDECRFLGRLLHWCKLHPEFRLCPFRRSNTYKWSLLHVDVQFQWLNRNKS